MECTGFWRHFYNTVATAAANNIADITVTLGTRTTVGNLTDAHAIDEQFKDKDEFKAKLREFYLPLHDHHEVFIFSFRVTAALRLP